MSNNNLLRLKYFLMFTAVAVGTITIVIIPKESMLLSIYGIIVTVGSIIFSELIMAHSFKTEKALVELFDLIGDEKYDEAEDILQQLKEQHGDMVPELAKAEAMLNFLNPKNSI